MKSKNVIMKKSLCVLLSILMMIPAVSYTVNEARADSTSLSPITSLVPITSVVPGSGQIPLPGSSSSGGSINVFMYQQNINFSAVAQLPMPPQASGLTTFMQGALKGFASWACTRAVQEITTLLIKEDIPGLSKALVLLQDPATRAELQHKQIVAQMAVSVEQIKASVARIESQLADISDKLDDYATAEALRDSIHQLNSIISKYQAAWGNYQSVITAGNNLATLEETYPQDSRTESQQALIDTAKMNFDLAVTMFINTIEEGGGFPFLSDLEKLPGYLWNPSDKIADYDVSYLGAYEAYLRERYPFEHQITPLLAEATETCLDIQTQMLILYREYYTYKASLEPENKAYSVYTPDYFASIQYGITLNTAAMIDSTEFESLGLENELTEEKLAEIKKLYPDFVAPETIKTDITVNGKTYKAYKVRDNSTLFFYKIIAKKISSSDFIEKIYSDSTNKYDTGKYIYRPSFMLDGRYSDDGLYEMICSKDQIPFAEGWVNLRATLRDSKGCNLKDIPEGLTHLLLYNDNFSANGVLKDSYWTLQLLNAENISQNAEQKTTEDIYGNSSISPLVIYKDRFSQTAYDKNNVLTLNDKGLVENRTFVVSSGQTLDISNISLDVSNVNIVINGEGKVISNPNITLKNSTVLISGTEQDDLALITNLKVSAPKCAKAALTISSSCTVGFEGDCSFTGNSIENANVDIYRYYNYKTPVLASQGILIEGENTTVSLTGVKDGTTSYSPLQKLTASGAGGGAGICHSGAKLTIKCLDVTASGSELSVDSDIYSTGEQIYSIGAGIGSSISCIIKSTGSYGVQTDEKINVLGSDTETKTNYLAIENSTVSASGIKSSRKITISDSILGNEIYSEDIGGVKLTDSGKYYCVNNGLFENSTISTKRFYISSRIKTSGGENVYKPENFKITAYTKGSNGVTTDGVYFKLKGTKGETDWMLASGCGNEKGSWSGTIAGVSVGKIQTVLVKTNSSNHWYPGKITINAVMGGESITVWGGRWIGNSEVVLSPNDKVYEVTVTTGNEANSGTDADISLYLKDKDGTITSTIDLSDINQYANAFEKGDTDTFPIYAPNDFDECTNAYFYSNHKNAAAGWLLSEFTVTRVQGGTDGFTFASGQWFEKEGTINFGKYSGSTGSFYLEIKTKNTSGAGTNSDIWLTIYGSDGTIDGPEMSTGEIELDTYAGDGDNFEKNDLDCFHVGVDKSIGIIQKIVITKNDAGAGPDWDLDYIVISEEVATGQTGQSVKFSIGKTIENTTYTFENPTPIVKSASRIDREILDTLVKNDDGSYEISANRNVTISEEIFAFLKESKISLTVNMMDEEKSLYSITFNGNEISDYTTIMLKKGYSFSDGNALVEFIGSAPIPNGTKLTIAAKNLGFKGSDNLVLFTKNENGSWEKNATLINENGLVEIPLSQGKEMLINQQGQPLPDTNIPSPGDTGIAVYFILAILSFGAVVLFRQKRKSL